MAAAQPDWAYAILSRAAEVGVQRVLADPIVLAGLALLVIGLWLWLWRRH